MMIDFGNIRLMAARGITFTPRIETEFWIKKALEEIKISFGGKKEIRCLDIFSGSGCLGIFILKNLDRAKVDFIDISGPCLEQLKSNLKLNGIKKKRFRIIQSDIFSELKKEKRNLGPFKLKGRNYDFIFANPPYVALERGSEVDPGVLANDPEIALFAGEKGMSVIGPFLREAKNFLKPRGVLFMEFDPRQKQMIEEILREEGYFFKVFKDQFNEDRWLRACLNRDSFC